MPSLGSGLDRASTAHCGHVKLRVVPKVLLVDADAAESRRLQSALYEAGYPVHSATSVSAALAQLLRQSFDVVVLRSALLDMSEERRLPCLKVLARHARLLLLADCPNSRADEAALAAGAEHIFCRPVDADTFVWAVGRAAHAVGGCREAELAVG